MVEAVSDIGHRRIVEVAIMDASSASATFCNLL